MKTSPMILKVLCHSHNIWLYRMFLSFRDTTLTYREQEYQLQFYYYLNSGAKVARRLYPEHPPERVHGDLSEEQYWAYLQETGIQLVITGKTEFTTQAHQEKGYPVILLFHGFLFGKAPELVQRILHTFEKQSFDRFYFTEQEAPYGEKYPQHDLQITYGSTNLDYLRSLDLEQFRTKLRTRALKKKKTIGQKSILLVQNHDGVVKFNTKLGRKYDHSEHYYQLLQATLNFAEEHDYHVFTKMKYKYLNKMNYPYCEQIKELCEHPRLTNVSRDQSIYPYFFCEIIIVESGGSTLPEALTHTPCTIRAQFVHPHNIFGMDEYPLLPQARSLAELENWLKTMDRDESWITPEVETSRQAWLKNYYRDQTRSTTEQMYQGVVEVWSRFCEENLP